MFRCILSMFFLLVVTSVSAEDNALWTKANSISLKTTSSATTQTIPGQLLSLSEALLDDALSKEQIILPIPMPDGEIIKVALTPILVMAEALADKYPGITTYKAIQIGKPNNYGRIDKTVNGFHGVINYQGETVYIDPLQSDKTILYRTYYANTDVSKRSSIERAVLNKKRNGLSRVSMSNKVETSELIAPLSKEYRIAFSTTGEYSQYHGGTREKVLSAIVTLVNRLNQVFEVDLGVRLTLVAASENTIFLDPLTDPFVNTDNDIFKNGEVLNEYIGEAEYDIGHVLSTGAGGLAVIAATCDNDPYQEFDNNGNVIASYTPIKAMGITGSSNPINDGFYIDFVAHEIGHQLGADHTFNGQSGSCWADNRNPSSAFEPGSGSTIMSYAGLCGDEDLQNQVDDYFHIHSIIEMNNYLVNDEFDIGQSCGAEIIDANNSPVINAGNDYNIPANSAFTLTAVASDADSDPLIYTWEQYDLGAPSYGVESMKDDGSKPIFRSFKPSSSSSRSFPNFNSLLTGQLLAGENFATTDRVLNFKATARDGNGGVATDDVFLTVHNNDPSGFQVKYPTGNDYWEKQEYSTVQWNVADTHTAPISCDSVSIEFSADNGKTFTQIAASVVNSGQAQITTPVINTVQARLKINCENNVFFAVSKEAFEVFNSDQPNTKPTILGLQIDSQHKSTQQEDTSFRLSIDDFAISDIDSRFPDDFTLKLLPGADYSLNGELVSVTENYNGALNINVQVNDGQLDSDSFVLAMNILPVNDLPIANDDELTIGHQTTTIIDVIANDTDIDNDVLELIGIEYNGGASISIENNSVVYDPMQLDPGVDTFVYIIRDEAGAIAKAKVTIELNKEPKSSDSGGVLIWLLMIMSLLVCARNRQKQYV